MSWTELSKAVAERAGVPTHTTHAVLTAFVEEVRERVSTGDSVLIWGLGTLERRWIAGRVVRGIADKRRMWVGGRFVPRFRPAAAFKRSTHPEADADWRSEAHQKAWRLAETLIDDLDLYHAAQRPTSLDGSKSDADIEQACAESFGHHWDQVRRTWNERVPSGVDTRFLGIVARRRWA